MRMPLLLAVCAGLALGVADARGGDVVGGDVVGGDVVGGDVVGGDTGGGDTGGGDAEGGDTAGGDPVAGETRYLVNCVNCHGAAGKGMASFPSIEGRDADYIAERLAQYRAREKVGPNSAIMMSLAAELSDDEIANLAAYVSATFK